MTERPIIWHEQHWWNWGTHHHVCFILNMISCFWSVNITFKVSMTNRDSRRVITLLANYDNLKYWWWHSQISFWLVPLNSLILATLILDNSAFKIFWDCKVKSRLFETKICIEWVCKSVWFCHNALIHAASSEQRGWVGMRSCKSSD